MVDYNKRTGTTATMRIRDTGTTVEFWLTSGNSSSYNHRLPWRFFINGVQGGWAKYRYTAGKGWVRLAAWKVTTTQDVTFEIGRSGTGGIGGPTTHKVRINRVNGPPPPNRFVVSSFTNSSVTGRATDNGNGGSPIIERQVGYGDSPVSVHHYAALDASGNGTFSANLVPGSYIYMWTRVRTAVGWSGWSARSELQLKKPPDKLATPIASDVAASSFTAKWGVNGHGSDPITHYRYLYGPANPPTLQGIAYSPTAHLDGLAPGTTQYFKVLAASAAGEGPWSETISVKTKGGSFLRSDGSMKGAVPYVKHAGVWRPAEVWVKIAGMWKRTE